MKLLPSTKSTADALHIKLKAGASGSGALIFRVA